MDSRKSLAIISCTLALAVACGRSSDQRHFTLQGQVTAIAAGRQEATVKHEEIAGFMPAMTMPYKVKSAAMLEGIAPGDLITATLVVLPNDAYLTEVRKVGAAPLEKPAAAAADAIPSASSGFELLNAGDTVPDAAFVDQDGRTIDFKSFHGDTVVLTFTYTRCPIPTFCPLMDRHFVSIQRTLEGDPALKNRRVHLVTVSFDPANDTPPVLKKHAQTLDADPKVWTFLTGDRDDVDRFAARFGVSAMRSPQATGEITHNLRTAIIDASGRLVKVYTGNDWTPAQVVSDLKAVAHAN